MSSNHLFMGAINLYDQCYVSPSHANRTDKYKCPCCDKPVFFRRGIKRRSHFAHYNTLDPCYYYDKPTESQIHKDVDEISIGQTPINLHRKIL